MDPAVASLVALALVIAISCVTTVNVGMLAIAFAWVIGVYITPDGSTTLAAKAKAVIDGFPSDLFMTLTGVTLLFALAQANGTLERVAERAVRACRGSARLLPLIFFVLAFVLSAVGPGNIAAVALIAPMAMAAGRQAGVSPLLMVIMVGHGSIAGGLSPVTPMGVIADKILDKMQAPGHEWEVFTHNLLANLAIAVCAYIALGGWRRAAGASTIDLSQDAGAKPWERRHWLSLLIITGLLTSVVLFKVHVGLGAFAASVLLIVLRLADEREAIRNVPWGVILMVSGMIVLVGVAEKTKGLDLFAQQITRFATADTIPGIIAGVTGVISVFSSTSGVVLPTFLPMAEKLATNLGSSDMLAVASSIVVGSNLVDVSPVSTIGALCLAAMPNDEGRRRLFYQLLAWGASMALVAAALCQLFFGVLRAA